MACDEALYRQYLSGDDAGLEVLIKKFGDPLTLYIDGYLHDVHEAEELMLDVFAYLFTKKPKIRDGGFKAYLFKAARHMALRHKSKRKPLFSLDALADEPDGRLLKCRGVSVRCLPCRDRGAVSESAGRRAFPRFPGSPMNARTGTRRGFAPRRNIG